MCRHALFLALTVLVSVAGVGSGLALNTGEVIELKAAGVSDETVAIIVSERVIETAAFSVADILALKQAGIGEKTLQALIRAGSFRNERAPIVYGRAVRPIRLASVEDIVTLKEAGFSDEVIQAIIAVAGSGADDERRRALDLLERMNIRVDLRGD